MKAILIFALLHFCFADSNVRIRWNRAFFDSAAAEIQKFAGDKLAAYRLEDRIISIPIPGSWKLQHFQTLETAPPKISYSLSNESLAVNSVGGLLKLSGVLRYYIGRSSHGFPTKIQISSFNADIKVNVVIDSGKPHLKITGCTMGVDVHINIYNLDSSVARKAEMFVRNEVETKGCSTLVDFVRRKVNQPITDLPSHYPLGFGFFVDWSADAFLNDPEFIQLDSSITAVFKNNSCPIQSAVAFGDHFEHSMMNIWLSEEVFNRASAAVQNSGVLHKLIDKDTSDLAPNLKTTCSDMRCIGFAIPELGQKYPDQYIDFYVASTEPMNISIETQGIVVNASAIATMHLNPRSEHMDALAQFSTNISVSLSSPRHEKGKITAEVTKIKMSFTVDESKIGVIPSMTLKLAETTVSKLLFSFLSSRTKQGFVEPSFGKYKINGDSRIVSLPKQLRIDLNATRTSWLQRILRK